MKTTRILFIALCLSVTAGAAHAAAYLKLGDIKGEARGQASAPTTVQAPQPAPAALLLPAVQKVREAAAR